MERTALGTASSKTSGTTLSLSSKTVHAGNSLVAGIVYETGQGAPTLKWGFRELSQIQVQAQSGMACALWVLRHINNTATRDIVAAWAGAITAKAMFATEVDGANVLDVATKQGQTATGSPSTGTPVTTTASATFHIGALASRGPSSDTIGTVGSGHTGGQRVGTVGAPPVSNVTIHETWEELTATGDTQSTKTGATSRDWALVIVALKEKLVNVRRGITPSDLSLVENKFEAVSKNFGDAHFYISEANDRWEVEDAAGVFVAHQENGWA